MSETVQQIDIKQIQQKQLEILVYFRDFCRENGLKFFLAGGTCLGAKRHQGFIPWDDDVDVFMLRDDYEKLREIWEEKADTERYCYVRSCKEFNIHHSATEIKDNNTTFINHHSKDLDINQGIMIDVIPMDAVAPGKFTRITQMIYAMAYCLFNFQRLPEHKGKLTYYASKIALGVIRSDSLRYKIWKFCEKRHSRFDVKKCTHVASFGEGVAIMRQHFPVEWFSDMETVLPFEGYDMPVAKDTHQYLTISYGDYMQLPPEEDRVFRHNIHFMDLTKSYKEYKGIAYCVDKK